MVVGSGIDVRGIDVLGQIFDFSGIEKSEKSIKKTWQEFRDALSKGDFSFDDIASAKKNTFLRVYDDLFNKNAGIEYNTVLISEIEKYCVGRGTILGEDENPDFERFIPKTEFIKEDNRFSPSGVEWLYLAIGKEAAIHECAQAECRVKQNDRFGFCHFQFAADSTALKVVDLTIADVRYLNIFGHCHREFPPIGWPACPIQLVWLFSCSSDSDRTVLDQETHRLMMGCS